MKRTALVIVALACLVVAGSANADLMISFRTHHAPTDVRVWLDEGYTAHHRDADYGYDVYETVDDVVLCVRAARTTFATVYVVDTDGFIHVVHPLSPRHNARLRGGHVYKFVLDDLSSGFGPGVAFAFAVSSPVPFDFSGYGGGVFGHGYGYQISGDPYVAARRFYMSLANTCDPGLIAVSHARFYVGHYTRYPAYLCVGWHDRHGVTQYCRSSCSAYRYYRVHAGDPYRILNPTVRISADVVLYGSINERVGIRYKADRNRRVKRHDQRVRGFSEVVADRAPVRETRSVADRAPRQRSSVRSTSDDFVRARSDASSIKSRSVRESSVRTARRESAAKTRTVKKTSAVKKSGADRKSQSARSGERSEKSRKVSGSGSKSKQVRSRK